MLVLSRKVGEKIIIGDNITLTVVKIPGNRVQIGIEAPLEIGIRREEVSSRNHRSFEVSREFLEIQSA